MDNHFRKVWSKPVLLALITLTGLLVSLVATGFLHTLGWIVLLIPLAVILRKALAG